MDALIDAAVSQRPRPDGHVVPDHMVIAQAALELVQQASLARRAAPVDVGQALGEERHGTNRQARHAAPGIPSQRVLKRSISGMRRPDGSNLRGQYLAGRA